MKESFLSKENLVVFFEIFYSLALISEHAKFCEKFCFSRKNNGLKFISKYRRIAVFSVLRGEIASCTHPTGLGFHLIDNVNIAYLKHHSEGMRFYRRFYCSVDKSVTPRYMSFAINQKERRPKRVHGAISFLALLHSKRSCESIFFEM